MSSTENIEVEIENYFDRELPFKYKRALVLSVVMITVILVNQNLFLEIK